MTNQQIKNRLELLSAQMKPLRFFFGFSFVAVFIATSYKPGLVPYAGVICVLSAVVYAYLGWRSLRLIKQMED